MSQPASREVKEAIRQCIYGKDGPGNADMALNKLKELAGQPGLNHRKLEVFLLSVTQKEAERILRGLEEAFGNQQERLRIIGTKLCINVA